VKLFDVDGNICLRTNPAPVCVRCSRDAPGELEAIVHTLGHHRRRAEARFPALERLPGPRTLARKWRDRRSEMAGRDAPGGGPADASAGQVAAFQLRRDINVARLSRVDRLIAVSPRVAEIYATLGVDPARLQTISMARTRLESLRPRRLQAVERPVRFITLSGCSSRAKGSRLVADALDELAAMGLTADDLTLSVAGQVDPYAVDRLTASPFVRLIGSYASDALDRMLEEFHVGIVPSVWEETHGWVGIELLAKGLPVVGNAVGGIVEYTRDGETGWLNRDCSATGLATIMADIARDPGQVVPLNHRIVERRAKLVKPMSTHLDELREVYAELVR
jgi:glycosyltransferase involved in cell wall biosynthesis